jgi:hypothetical protein
VNHPNTDIADAIIAGLSADSPLEQMTAIVTSLEHAGFTITPTAQHEALMATAKLVFRLRPWCRTRNCECDSCAAIDETESIQAALRSAGIMEKKT